MDRDRMDEIQDKLQELGQWETVSVFSQAFYGLIAGKLGEQDARAAGLRLAFADFLAAEVNYHRQLGALASRDVMLAGDLQSLADKRRVNLEAVEEMVALAPASGRELSGLRHLILAECHYHRRDSQKVVEHLRAAIESGHDHPLVHFALGYNLYAVAVQEFTVMRSADVGLSVTDDIAFAGCCIAALAALEGGLSGGDFDAQVYWWMGHVLESAGMTEAARDLHVRVTGLSGESWDDADDEESYPSELEEAAEAPRYLPQITEDEINRATQLLRGSFTSSEVLGYDPGDD